MSKAKRIDPGDYDVERVTAAGIPALAHVTDYTPARRGAPMRHDRNCDLIDPGTPDEPEDVEIELYDRKGYRARWLEDRLTADQWDDVHEQVLAERAVADEWDEYLIARSGA